MTNYAPVVAKRSYTYRCPTCGDARSYAPDLGERVVCTRPALRNPEGRIIREACPGTLMHVVQMHGESR